jgi:hypothetical protein
MSTQYPSSQRLLIHNSRIKKAKEFDSLKKDSATTLTVGSISMLGNLFDFQINNNQKEYPLNLPISGSLGPVFIAPDSKLALGISIGTNLGIDVTKEVYENLYVTAGYSYIQIQKQSNSVGFLPFAQVNFRVIPFDENMVIAFGPLAEYEVFFRDSYKSIRYPAIGAQIQLWHFNQKQYPLNVSFKTTYNTYSLRYIYQFVVSQSF